MFCAVLDLSSSDIRLNSHKECHLSVLGDGLHQRKIGGKLARFDFLPSGGDEGIHGGKGNVHEILLNAE